MFTVVRICVSGTSQRGTEGLATDLKHAIVIGRSGVEIHEAPV